MSSAATVMARFLAVAFFLVIALAIYAFILNSDLNAAQQAVNDANQARDDLQNRITSLERNVSDLEQNLQACQTADESADG